MFNQYFQNELGNLRELGGEFARRYPAVAPMLSGMSTDPDTERLLEGVAFLTAMLRQRLDDDFPEIIQELFQLIWPHYLRPIPSTTIVDFSPKSGLKQSVKVPKGVLLASEPVDGTPCYFQTCCDVDVHPLTLEKASLEETPGKSPMIRLGFALHGVQLSEWQPERLRIHLTGDPRQASDIYLMLSRHLKRIVISPEGDGESCLIAPNQLKPAGFGASDSLLPYPKQAFPGYRLIQEYFILPEKFLFLDIEGFQSWQNRGSSSKFEVRFELKEIPFASPKLRKENFALAATPAINLFTHDADPIRLDHLKSEYIVRPAGSNDRNFQVYTVQRVTGYVQGTAQERIYKPFEMFSPNPEADPTFHMSIRQSPVRQGFDFYLSVAYPTGSGDPAPETLSIGLQCTNGVLPEGLQVGDICHPTSSTPEFVDFKNIRPPTSSIVPQLGQNLHWKLLSHLCLNYRSLASAENLRALLELYNFEENRDRPAFMANQKKVTGIEEVTTLTLDRLVDRVIMRGREIRLNLRQDHFAGVGDLFLFGSVLDHFLGLYASLNTFTQLTVKEALKGEVYQWPPRIGEHPLI